MPDDASLGIKRALTSAHHITMLQLGAQSRCDLGFAGLAYKFAERCTHVHTELGVSLTVVIAQSRACVRIAQPTAVKDTGRCCAKCSS